MTNFVKTENCIFIYLFIYLYIPVTIGNIDDISQSQPQWTTMQLKVPRSFVSAVNLDSILQDYKLK
jgi:hypothetical protein